jgi:hypothetical protein
MICNYVKMFEEAGNVDVVGRVAWSTAVAEDRIGGDSELMTTSYLEIAQTRGLRDTNCHRAA